MDPRVFLLAFVVACCALALKVYSRRRPAPPERDTDPPTKRDGRPDWGAIAVWSFIFTTFVASIVAGCMIWTKCGPP